MFFNAEKVWNMFGSMKDKQGKNIETCGYMIHKNILHQMEKCNKFEQKFEISDNPQELTPIVCGLTGHDGRPYCTYEKPYGSIIWHTHPIGSKSYPSNEDIIKGLKPRTTNCQIVVSLLICEWGIWEWSASNKTNVDQEKMNIFLSHNLKKIYEATEKGRGKLTEQGRSVINRVIDKLTETLNTKFQFKIYFTSWEDMRNNDQYPYYYMRL